MKIGFFGLGKMGFYTVVPVIQSTLSRWFIMELNTG
jgi:3-hydroxyisobutyrate dehydrogenase-like beta-hydroxyacid dehydrogenase